MPAPHGRYRRIIKQREPAAAGDAHLAGLSISTNLYAQQHITLLTTPASGFRIGRPHGLLFGNGAWRDQGRGSRGGTGRRRRR
jgi:hypothetical protein